MRVPDTATMAGRRASNVSNVNDRGWGENCNSSAQGEGGRRTRRKILGGHMEKLDPMPHGEVPVGIEDIVNDHTKN